MDFKELSKERPFIKVSSFNENKESLLNIPYTIIENIAITYHIMVKTDYDSMTSIVVTDSIIKKLGINKEKLHNEAVENSMRILPVYVANIKNMIFRNSDRRKFIHDTSDIREIISEAINEEEVYPLFVVTNKFSVYGASAIFYPGVMEQIGDSLGNNYFILPSSIHEMIILPDDGKIESGVLKNIVESVNIEIVDQKDLLTNDVYYYDIDKHLFKTINI